MKKRIMHSLALSILFVLTSSAMLCAQQWEVMHPGGGGYVMNIDCDPNTPGKIFESSDMEGTNVSFDYGLTWENTGRTQLHTFNFTNQVKPGNSDIVLSGTIMGLEKSTDGGLTWNYIDDFYPNPEGDNDRGSVSAIAWDPANPNYVYAAHGWLGRGSQLTRVTGSLKQKTNGSRKIGVSHDGGETWNFISWNSIDGDKNCYGVKVNPVNGHVYLSTEAGIYESSDHGLNWSKISTPSDAVDNTKGLSVSSNGEYLYASFRKSSNNSDDYRIYGMRLSEKIWYSVHGPTKEARYFDPFIDPRDHGDAHHLLVAGLANPVSGLWEGLIQWTETGEPSFTWEQIFKESWNVNSGGYTYDQGWRPTSAKCSQHLYTPEAWDRMIWTTDDEGIFVGNPDESKFSRWEPRYCERVGTRNGDGLYTTRGFESTWTWDVDAADNFVVQGQADNGVVQSWDNGYSWQRYLPANNFSDCGATLIIKGSDPKSLLVGGAINVYGGGNENDPGKLYGRQLPDGEWRFGGDFPKIYSLIEDPFDNDRVYMGTAKGLYTLSGINSWINFGGTPESKSISNSLGNPNIKEIKADPYHSGRIYVICEEGTYRVDNAWSSSPSWNWIRSTSSVGQSTKSLATWAGPDNTTYIAIGENDKIYLSNDDGDNWNTVINEAIIKQARPLENEPAIQDGVKFYCNAIDGIADVIYVALEADIRKGYGVLRGMISDGSVTWNDYSGEGEDVIKYSRSRRAKIRESNGKHYIYLATSGNGVWRKEVLETPIITGIQGSNTIKKNSAGQFKIFPNPVNDKLTIQINDNNSYIVTLIGIDGKQYYQWLCNSKINTFDISNLSKGVYFILIGHQTIKIIK
jgi:hypothetical protein